MSTEVVECYSGETYAERPLAFHWQGERLEIVQIETRWQSPEGRYFRVRVMDGHVFDLFYHEALDEWKITER